MFLNVRLHFRRNSGCYGRRDILRELRDWPDNIFLAVAALGNSPTRLEVHGAVHRQVDISVLFKEGCGKSSLIDDRTFQICMHIESHRLDNSREIAIVRVFSRDDSRCNNMNNNNASYSNPFDAVVMNLIAIRK